MPGLAGGRQILQASLHTKYLLIFVGYKSWKKGWRPKFQSSKSLCSFKGWREAESVLSLLQQDSCDRLFKHSWEQLKTPGPVLSSWAASDWLTYIIYRCPEPHNNFCTLQAFPVKGGMYNPSSCGVISPPSQQSARKELKVNIYLWDQSVEAPSDKKALHMQKGLLWRSLYCHFSPLLQIL